jgi:cold shock CspA family protein/ribosome-associated translation inhibitor RaiA
MENNFVICKDVKIKSAESVKKRIVQEAQKLERIFNRIQHCSVVISLPHRAHQQGKIFHINLTLHVPGKVLVVNQEPELNHAHEDAFVAIRDAFRSMEKELTSFVNKRKDQKLRSFTHSHRKQKRGVIETINNIDRHGFIRGEDRVDYYFHANSVLNEEFNKLQKGDIVRFADEQGEKGPQASSLSLVTRA